MRQHYSIFCGNLADLAGGDRPDGIGKSVYLPTGDPERGGEPPAQSEGGWRRETRAAGSARQGSLGMGLSALGATIFLRGWAILP